MVARLLLMLCMGLGVVATARAQTARLPARPTFAQITTLAEASGLRHVAIHGSPLPFGTPTRWTVVVSSSSSAEPSLEVPRDATLLVIARETSGFVIASSARLPIAPIVNVYEDRRGRDFTIATWRAEDVDGDGALELAMVVRFVVAMACGEGQLWQSEYMVVDLAPSARVALAVPLERYAEGGYFTLRGHASHEDRNGDGHPDVRVRARDCEPDGDGQEVCRPPRYVDYLWSAATDAYAAATTPASAAPAPCHGR